MMQQKSLNLKEYFFSKQKESPTIDDCCDRKVDAAV